MKIQYLIGAGAIVMVLANAAYIWVALHMDDGTVASYETEAR